MKKILIVAKYWSPFRGGIEDNARSAMASIAGRYAITAIAFNHLSGSSHERMDGIDLRRCRTDFVLKSQPLSIEYFFRILAAEADLIYFHAPNVLGSLAVLLKLLFSRRRIHLVTIHHMDIYGRPLLRRVARRLYDGVLRRCDRLIVTSLKNAAISHDIRVPVPTEAIPLGITPENFVFGKTDLDDAVAWRKSLCGDAPAIVFVGRLARYKGLDVLVRAMEHLPDAMLLIAGDGPYREQTQQLVATLGLSSRIRLLGDVSHEQKLKLLTLATVFAFPSTEVTEAFGVSQLEAMLLGAPVVASNLPTGVTDVAIDGETALLVPPGDHLMLADRLGRLIADAPLRARLAATARERVLARYTTALMASRNAELIARVLDEAPAAGKAGHAAASHPVPAIAGIHGAPDGGMIRAHGEDAPC